MNDYEPDHAVADTLALLDARPAARRDDAAEQIKRWLAANTPTRCAPEIAPGVDFDPADIKRPGSRVRPEPDDAATDAWLAEHDPTGPGQPKRKCPRQGNGQPSRRRADLVAETSDHHSVARRVELIALARGAVAELPESRHEEYALNADNRFDLGVGGRAEAPAASAVGALFLAGILSPDILVQGAELRRLWRMALGGNGSGYPSHSALHGFVLYGDHIDCGGPVHTSAPALDDLDDAEPVSPDDPDLEDPTAPSFDPRNTDAPADDATDRLESARALVGLMCPPGCWSLLKSLCTDAGTPAPAGAELRWLVVALCLAGVGLGMPEPVTEHELRRMRADAHRSYTGTGLQYIHLNIGARFRAAEFCPATIATARPAIE